MAWLTDVLERVVSGRTKANELHALLPWSCNASRRPAILYPWRHSRSRRSGAWTRRVRRKSAALTPRRLRIADDGQHEWRGSGFTWPMIARGRGWKPRRSQLHLCRRPKWAACPRTSDGVQRRPAGGRPIPGMAIGWLAVFRRQRHLGVLVWPHARRQFFEALSNVQVVCGCRGTAADRDCASDRGPVVRGIDGKPNARLDGRSRSVLTVDEFKPLADAMPCRGISEDPRLLELSIATPHISHWGSGERGSSREALSRS